MNVGFHHTALMPLRSFALIKLAVVVFVLVMIAAIAAPKMSDTANDAREISAKQSMRVIRDAIELFYAQTGVYPGQTGGTNGLKADLATSLRFRFPVCPVGNQNSNINASATSGPLSPTGLQGWAYSKTTGEFIINHASYSSW